jgi:regulator of protease activity HflC (stomatin/prohibitin superfamily)
MGLGNWFIGLGIKAEGLAAQVGKRTGALPLAWHAGRSESVIWRLPRDPHERASIFARSQTIVVNEGEVAVVIEDGIAGGALPPGRYTFDRARIVGSLDVIWMKTGQRDLRWGVGNISTSDGIQVSGSGVVYVRVGDAVRFNTEVVQGEMSLPVSQLQRLLLPRIQGVLRSEMRSRPRSDTASTTHSRRWAC